MIHYEADIFVPRVSCIYKMSVSKKSDNVGRTAAFAACAVAINHLPFLSFKILHCVTIDVLITGASTM